MGKLKAFLRQFRSPHIVIIALVGAVTALSMMAYPDKAAFMFSAGLASGFLTAAALAMRTRAENTSVLLFVLSMMLLGSIALWKDHESFGAIDPVEALLASAAGSTVALIMTALEQHMKSPTDGQA